MRASAVSWKELASYYDCYRAAWGKLCRFIEFDVSSTWEA